MKSNFEPSHHGIQWLKSVGFSGSKLIYQDIIKEVYHSQGVAVFNYQLTSLNLVFHCTTSTCLDLKNQLMENTMRTL